MSNDNEGFEPLLSAPTYGKYTAQQKGYFDNLIKRGDNLSMYIFKSSLVEGDASGPGASIWMSLCNSFEKGSKGKYSQVVLDMTKAGEKQSQSIIADLEAVASSGDEYGVKEIISELSVDEYKFIASELTHESVLFVDKIWEEHE